MVTAFVLILMTVLCAVGLVAIGVPVEGAVFATLVVAALVISFALSDDDPIIFDENQLRRF